SAKCPRGVRSFFAEPPTAKRQEIREVLATVVFESLTHPAFGGARGETAPRHVLLRAQEFDIHLKISLDPSVRQMVGQVFARDETEFLSSVRLQLMQNGTPLKTTWTDIFGEFHFNELPQGELRLQVVLLRLTVVGGMPIV